MIHLSRIGISVAVAIAVGLWALYLAIADDRAFTWADAAPFGTVVAILVVLGLFFEYRLWRAAGIRSLIGRPDINGTWKGEMVSNFKDGDGNVIPPIPCYAAVEQTFSELKLHMMTEQSESWLVASDIRKSNTSGGYQIVGIYTNQPGIHLREQSQIHRGTVWLESHGPKANPTSLTGEYWNDRYMKGTVTLGDRVDEVISRFDEADAYFSNASS